MKRIAVIALALVLVVATGSAAANTGNGKGRVKEPPTLTVSGTLVVGEQLTIAGNGFASRKAVFLVFDDDSTLPILVETDRAGTFTTDWMPAVAGPITITSYQLKKKNGWEFATNTNLDIGP